MSQGDSFCKKACQVFIVLSIIITSLLCIIIMLNRYTVEGYPKETEIIEISSLRTGDIVGVAYYNFAGGMVAGLTKSIWTHTGVIWVNPNTLEPYVLEAANYRNTIYKNIFMIPFSTWYALNKRSLIGLKRYVGPEIDGNKMLQVFNKYKGIKLEGFNLRWARFLTKHKYDKNYKRNSYTCFEVTIQILQDIGIYRKDYQSCSFFPRNIMESTIGTNYPNCYLSTVEMFIHPMELALMRYPRNRPEFNSKNKFKTEQI